MNIVIWYRYTFIMEQMSKYTNIILNCYTCLLFEYSNRQYIST